MHACLCSAHFLHCHTAHVRIGAPMVSAYSRFHECNQGKMTTGQPDLDNPSLKLFSRLITNITGTKGGQQSLETGVRLGTDGLLESPEGTNSFIWPFALILVNTFLIVVTKYLTETISKMKDLFWFIFSKSSSPCGKSVGRVCVCACVRARAPNLNLGCVVPQQVSTVLFFFGD